MMLFQKSVICFISYIFYFSFEENCFCISPIMYTSNQFLNYVSIIAVSLNLDNVHI